MMRCTVFLVAVAVLQAMGALPTGMRPIIHDAPDRNQQAWADALVDFGCAGAVVQCPSANGFTANPTNLAVLGTFLSTLRQAGLSYWIYDEVGYPSGSAGGLTLKGHPELEAKGFYMRKFVALDERRTFDFRRECDADKIVWAAKYALKPSRKAMGEVDWTSCQAVPFTDDAARATVGPNEVYYVFSVRRAYEGSHLVHNVFSRRRTINILEPKAVRRFIDVAYEPITRALPDAYAQAGGVFTDEPSLQTCFVNNPHEMWNWALLPWKEGLFEDYAAAYGGERLESLLPALFEGNFAVPSVCRVRVRFHELVGQLVAKAWSRQLSGWCRAHGTRFSGHYLLEESLRHHVAMYGNLFTVLKETGCPGVDTLHCTPETYDFKTGKFAQMAVRKNRLPGMMVEFCPFADREQFERDPVGNFRAVIGEMFLSGVREVQSYCHPNYQAFGKGELSAKGLLSPEQARAVNEYIARLSSVLGGLSPSCSVFVYVNVNEIQARFVPEHSTRPLYDPGISERDMTVIARRIYESGHDFMFVDDEDIRAASRDAEARITDLPAKVVVVPPSEVLSASTLKALVDLRVKGAQVMFLNRLPRQGTDGEALPSEMTAAFRPARVEDIDSAVRNADSDFAFRSELPQILHARFPNRGGERHFLVNRHRSPVSLTVTVASRKEGRLTDLVSGTAADWHWGDTIVLPPLGAVVLDIGEAKEERAP